MRLLLWLALGLGLSAVPIPELRLLGLTWALLGLAAGLYSASGRWLLRADFGPALVRHWPGAPLELPLTLTNQGPWPFWLSWQDGLGDLEVFSPREGQVFLPPFSRIQLVHRVRSRRRGVHPLGPFRLDWADPGLWFPRHWAWNGPRELLIYPPWIGAEAPAARGEALGPSRRWNDPWGDPSRVRDWVPWSPGVPLSRIDAKISARAGQWMQRRYEPTRQGAVFLVLDWDLEAYPLRRRHATAERALEAAARIGLEVLRQGRPLGWVLIGAAAHPAVQARRPHNGGDTALAWLEALARAQPWAGPGVSGSGAPGGRQPPQAQGAAVRSADPAAAFASAEAGAAGPADPGAPGLAAEAWPLWAETLSRPVEWLYVGPGSDELWVQRWSEAHYRGRPVSALLVGHGDRRLWRAAGVTFGEAGEAGPVLAAL